MRTVSEGLVGGGVVDLFRLRGFVRLLLVRWPSQAGDGMFQLGAAALLLFALDPTEATSAGEVATILAVTTLPFSFVGPFAGVLIDRWRRQRILVWANLLRIAVVLAVLPLADRGRFGEALFLAGVVAALSTNRFFLATLGAVLPKVVPGEALTAGNAVATIGGTIAALVGAGAGGVVADLVGEDSGGPEVAVLLAVGLFLASVASALRLPVSTLGPDRDEQSPPLRRDLARAWGELVDGMRRVAAARRAWAPIATLSGVRFLTAIVTISVLLVFRNRFGASAGELGLLFVLFGAGAFVGAVGVTWLDRRWRLRPETHVETALLVGAVATVALAPGGQRWALLALNVLLGVSFALAKIPADALVQSALPDRLRGRVFAAYDVLYNVGFLAGAIVAALAVPDADAAGGALVGAGLTGLALWFFARRWLRGLPPAVDVETWEEARRAV